MPNGLKVISAGAYASIQDRGRIGYRKYGVPVSGTMDQYSADMANYLLGNSIEDAVMEMLATGGKFEFLCPTHFVVSGADFSPILNGQPIELNKPYLTMAGDVLGFGTPIWGQICYLAVKGGFQTREVFDSRSEFEGITLYPRILKDRVLEIEHWIEPEITANAKIKLNISHFQTVDIEVLPGPEFESHFSEIESGHFKISPKSNRMAYQFMEPTHLKSTKNQMLTSSVLPGTVQLTPSGQLIVLMRDCQTTGGYPRIFQLTERAINELAQKRVGETIRFRCIHDGF